MNDTNEGGGVYVREARPDEYDAIARLLTRAFAYDPSMNWLGSVTRRVPIPPADEMKELPLWRLPKELELLYYFRHAYVVSAVLSGGYITVAVRPELDGLEKILSVAAWFPPGAKVNDLLVIIRSKQHRAIFGSWRRPGGWGIRGLKRCIGIALPAIDRSLIRTFRARGLNYEDSWTVSSVGTDSDEIGKGYCRLVLDHGMEKLVRGAPICLAATTAKSRDMYAHFGFEVVETLTFGEGDVSKEGFASTKGTAKTEEALPGIQFWPMTRIQMSMS